MWPFTQADADDGDADDTPTTLSRRTEIVETLHELDEGTQIQFGDASSYRGEHTIETHHGDRIVLGGDPARVIKTRTGTVYDPATGGDSGLEFGIKWLKV